MRPLLGVGGDWSGVWLSVEIHLGLCVVGILLAVAVLYFTAYWLLEMVRAVIQCFCQGNRSPLPRIPGRNADLSCEK